MAATDKDDTNDRTSDYVDTNDRTSDYVANLPRAASSLPHQREIALKLLIIGDIVVGKTSLVQRYVNNVFYHRYKATIGVDFNQKELQWSDDLKVKLQLWDIAGAEKFSHMTRAYYRNANGCLVMFALDNSKTFEGAATWKEGLDEKCRLPDGSRVPSLLVGNKSDLSNWQVNRDQMHELSTRYKFIGWREMSVKDNLGVDEVMRFLVLEMLAKTGINEPEKASAETQDLEASTVVPPFGRGPPEKEKERTCC